MRPRIGITSNFRTAETAGSRPQAYLNASYVDAVLAAGGLPLLLPVPDEFDATVVGELLARVQGLVLTGGLDLSPDRYAEPRHPQTRTLPARRERFEFEVFAAAEQADLPTLCICLGHQLAHVARGGRLHQHIPDLATATRVAHDGPAEAGAYHTVRIAGGSGLHKIVGQESIEVNSRHHQAVDAAQPGRGLRTVATAPDGLIEASEDPTRRFLLTVQWHPEDLRDRAEQRALFEELVRRAE